MNSFPILSLLIWVPIVTGLGIACASKLDAKLPQTLSALIATVMLALSGLVVSQFMGGDVGFKLQQEIPWITSLGSTYSLGVDSMAAWMILLTSFKTVGESFSLFRTPSLPRRNPGWYLQ
jgi:NADH-quinone oxidoreductase subunit M